MKSVLALGNFSTNNRATLGSIRASRVHCGALAAMLWKMEGQTSVSSHYCFTFSRAWSTRAIFSASRRILPQRLNLCRPQPPNAGTADLCPCVDFIGREFSAVAVRTGQTQTEFGSSAPDFVPPTANAMPLVERYHEKHRIGGVAEAANSEAKDSYS